MRSILKDFLRIFLIAMFPFWSQGQELVFKSFQIGHGLSQNSVIAIAEGSDGFMWFGTSYGLNRFDGSRFRIYASDPRDTTSLSSSYILSIHVDSKKRLWVGTENGLNLYNDQKDAFTRVDLVGNDPQYNDAITINDIDEDHEGHILVTTNYGLFRSSGNQDHEFERIPVYNNFSEEIRSLKAMHRDSSNNLWVGADGAIVRITFSDIVVSQSYIRLQSSEVPNVSYVSSINEISGGTLCIGTNLGGLFFYDIQSDTFRNITQARQGSGLISNIVRSIFIHPSTHIWVGTRYGISVFNQAGEFIRNYQQDWLNPASLSDNSVRSIFRDSHGSIWVGTFFGGVNITDDSFFPVAKLTYDSHSEGLNNSIVSAIFYDGRDRLIVGTEGGGINIFDGSKRLIRTIEQDPADENSLSLNNVKCIFKDSEGLYWIGTSGGGADVYDRNFNLLYKVKGGDKNEREDYVYSITEDKRGRIWLGTFGGGLNYFDKERQALHHLYDASTNLSSVEMIYKVFMDSGDRLWIGTNNKLLTLDTKTNKFRRMLSSGSVEAEEGVYAILEDQQGTIWIGTEGGGVKKYDAGSDSFIAYTTADGLPDNNVVGIAEDRQHNDLWLCTNKGLCRFKPELRKSNNYTTEDGLLDLGFNRNATYSSSTGELFFGSGNGLISFFPELIKENKDIADIRFTGLKVHDENVRINDERDILDRQMTMVDEIILQDDQNFITIEFSLLSYIKPSKNTYAYRLEGIDKQWNYVNTPYATYTNLPHGEYILYVKGRNNDGYWTEVPATLHISILPAPWETWWAYTIYTLVLFGLIYLIVYFQYVKTRLKHELKIEQLHLKQEEEVHQLKMKFFTNISHEIRTPLTLIISPVEKLIAEYRHEHTLLQQLINIKANGDRLLRLVNQLLDFRRKEIGEIELKVAKGNIVDFIKEIWLSFMEQAKAKEITFLYDIEVEEIDLWYDRDEMEKVFFNLFSNALKFTHAGKKVMLTIASIPKIIEGTEYFEVRISNEGKGIPQDMTDDIFHRFYTNESYDDLTPGFGIGLALAKTIVEAHSGKIHVTSSPIDQDTWLTEFTVLLPHGKEHFSEYQLITDFEDSENLQLYKVKEFDAQIPLLNAEGITTKNEDSPIILVAEDNVDIRTYVKSCLEPAYHIIEADNGLEAWNLAIDKIPDIIITDVLMPELDGIQLCSRLKTDSRTCHIPIIILSARTSLIHRREGLQTGADDYLNKPFNVEELLLKIKNLLRSREILRAKYSQQFILQPENLDITSSEKEFLVKLKSIVEEHLADPDFHIPDFSGELGMSRSVIYRKLKGITGMTLIEFVNDYRLSKASLLLKHKKLNVSQTAIEVGFSDPNYFSKSFRKKYGISPSDFVKEN